MTEKMELEDAITTAVPVMVIDKYAFWAEESLSLQYSPDSQSVCASPTKSVDRP